MRRLVVVANWKMNGSKNSILELMPDIVSGVNDDKTIIICPPYVYLEQVKFFVKDSNIKLGVQDIDYHENGAFTSGVSVSMVKDFFVQYVILGHSERRALYNDTNDILLKKITTVLKAKITPIFCVGESLKERSSGNTNSVITRQINVIIDSLGVEVFKNIIVAYEPIWAIGTGNTATLEQAQSVHAFIRGLIALKDNNIAKTMHIIYGGSVNDTNSRELFACIDIDGALVGGASLKAASFLNICRS